MLLGDSYVDGACVPEGLDLGNQLRNQGLSVFNLGCGGNGPLAMIGTWREYHDLVKPEIVVWFYFEGNDLLNISEEKNTLLRKYLDPAYTQNLLRRDEERVAELATLLKKTARQYKKTKELDGVNASKNQRRFLFNLLTLYNIREYFGVTSRGINLRAYEQVFLKFYAQARRENQKVLFVYLPSFYSISVDGKRPIFPSRYEDYRSYIIDLVERSGVSFLDFEQVLLNQSDPEGFFPFRRYNHYGPAAYLLLSKEIAAVIKQM